MFTLAAALGRDCYVQQTRVDWVDQQSPEWAAERSKLRLEFDPWWRGPHKPPTGRPPWTFKIPADCTRINIRSHGMEDEGAHALAKALKACVACAVEELHLNDNNITSDGAGALAELLRPEWTANHRIHTVALGGNTIGAVGARAFEGAIRDNDRIRVLSLHFQEPELDAAVLDRLQARCDENWERHFAAREAHEAAAEVAHEMDEDEAAIWARVDAERREWEEDDDVRDLYGLRDEL